MGEQDVLSQLYTQARAAQLAGDYKTAIQKYERIISLRHEADKTKAETNPNKQ